ncbi:MAG: DNA polymerase III subunit delta [Rickettsiales bacterium]|nr:DNA polymerase III subunit delta [Rickettsiales bacterium]
MAKIETARFESFVKSKEYLKFSSILICGQDYGAISNSLKILEKEISPNDDPFTTAKIDVSQITEESTIILDELSAISFGGGRRLVSVKNIEGRVATEKLIATIADITPEISENALLLITSGDLSKDSSLRKLFESERNLAYFHYYAENERNLAAKINQLFQKNNIKAPQDACEALAELCKGDASIMQNEVEKISLYLQNKGEVTLEDIYNLTGNSSETSVQDIANYVFLGDFPNALQKYRKAIDDGVVPIFLFRALRNYIEKLEYGIQQTKEGKNVAEIMRFMRIFFTQQDFYKKHLQRLSKSNNFDKLYHILYEAESKIKTSNSEPEIITEQVIYKLSA